MNKYAPCCLLLLVLVISLAAPARADFIELTSPGCGEMILDTQANLEWLPLTDVQNVMSYNQVLAALAPGGQFYGFSLATPEQLQSLMQDFFGTLGSVNITAAYQFTQLFGVPYGYVGPIPPKSPPPPGFSGEYFTIANGFGDGAVGYVTYTAGYNPETGQWYYIGVSAVAGADSDPPPMQSPNYVDQEYSFWLVQVVPEPCTVLFVGSGLAGLVAYRKRFVKV